MNTNAGVRQCVYITVCCTSAKHLSIILTKMDCAKGRNKWKKADLYTCTKCGNILVWCVEKETMQKTTIKRHIDTYKHFKFPVNF